jgi:hypothetical protein
MASLSAPDHLSGKINTDAQRRAKRGNEFPLAATEFQHSLSRRDQKLKISDQTAMVITAETAPSFHRSRYQIPVFDTSLSVLLFRFNHRLNLDSELLFFYYFFPYPSTDYMPSFSDRKDKMPDRINDTFINGGWPNMFSVMLTVGGFA